MSVHAIPIEAPTKEDLRQTIEVDIACAGFGPAMGGFLTTLTRAWSENPSDPAFESRVSPGSPLQVICYERADDISAGVSGVVTNAREIRASFPTLKPDDIPMCAAVKKDRVLYLLDPIGASRRSLPLRVADTVLKGIGRVVGLKDHSFQLPWTPAFLHKRGGLVLSIGQFNQWVGSQLMAGGLVQIWPATPVSGPLFAGNSVVGLRLADQGVNQDGIPTDGFMPGLDVRAHMTVVGDGPVGAVGQAIDQKLGLPPGRVQREWALGMKMVIELPPHPSNSDAPKESAFVADRMLKEKDTTSEPLEPGTVWHTFGYPEPEIFGFLYVHPDRLVSVGIFVPASLRDPSRTAYRYLQHYIQHPALWRYLKNGTLRSWGAKSLQESGRRGEPFLAGDNYARIGEGSGSTNMLTGSGVDEAWATGTQLGEAIIDLLRTGRPFTRSNLDATYKERRRNSWVERGARKAEFARIGFQGGIVKGMIGMALAGLTNGHLALGGDVPPAHEQLGTHAVTPVDDPCHKTAVASALESGRPVHDALLTARGWPEIVFDGQLLVSQQDALLIGGKVQAMPGFADHVRFRDLRLCTACDEKTCIAMCSGQAITLGAKGRPVFEREKCIHCGACLWNCSKTSDGEQGNIEFCAGAGGLHSAEN
jgi:electron-transferring-flavoprotein dehydrogenase